MGLRDRSSFSLRDFPRDLPGEAALGLSLLALLVVSATVALHLKLVREKLTVYTLECIDLRTGQRDTYYDCPSIKVELEQAWCGGTHIRRACSGRVQD
jgi:hypothetical protein